MKVKAANTGSYPRIGHDSGQMRLRNSYRDWEKGEISDAELEEVYRDYTKEIIEEQESAGLDVITDGQLRWYDPFSHFAKYIEGCKINGLLRYFDTNFYFRQPVIEGTLNRTSPIVLEEYKSASEFADKILKPVLTGPHTLAKYSINKSYDNFENLVYDFAKIISNEVEQLEKAGAKEIQLNEPAVLRNPEDFEVFSKGIEIVSGKVENAQMDLYIYFEDSALLYDKLQELPVDLIGLDFTYAPELTKTIEEKGSDKKLGLGLVNARNTKMEDGKKVLETVKRISLSVDQDEVYLNPSCGIEFLPRKRAFEKLQKISELARKAEGDLK